jgi:hypothetical protein
MSSSNLPKLLRASSKIAKLFRIKNWQNLSELSFLWRLDNKTSYYL